MRIAWEEPFGPVVPIMRVPDVEAAVQHCNSSNFGLQGCVFTRDINTAMRISDAMQTGTVQVKMVDGDRFCESTMCCVVQ
jgi:glyceraldehyde-3-phosphate dehydrogenase (NADP+)